jgi:hypothetical protein
MPRRDLRILLALSVMATGLALAHSSVAVSTGFLFLAPALLMLSALLAGRYIGADRLARIARSLPSPRREVPIIRPARRSFRRVPPRGGLLIGASLAVRPPPPLA